MENPIIRRKTKCITKENEIILELFKSTPGIWSTLNTSVGKHQLIDLKQQIIAQQHDLHAEEVKKKECKAKDLFLIIYVV